ncbi:MAG TPA: AraC family transcriptional regulator [Rhizomicrobium sp.]
MIKFGSWSTMLGVAAVFGAVVAGLLLLRPHNRTANRFLAALLIVAVLRLMPYVLGFAGFYDAYPWLSFAPFDLALSIGPLLYLYVRRLVTTALPRHWWLHFLPAAADLLYTVWAFLLPLADKLRWNDDLHRPYIDPAERLAAIVSLAVYLFLAVRFRQRYGEWLAENLSDREEHRQPWIGTILGALCLWLFITAGFDLADGVFGLSYYERFPQYLLFAGIVIWLGLEGWRHSDRRFPPMSAPVPAPVVTPVRDWAVTGTAWAERVRQEGWWREAGLSLSDVARRLATNESYVSKAFNEGLGQNFNAVINGFRIEAVKVRMIETDSDVLDLALESGFASKASFNRVFRNEVGMSPTAWRKSQIQKTSQNLVFGATGKADAAI